ncbi:hypothetical protein D3C87_1642090 [compost metagenome]
MPLTHHLQQFQPVGTRDLDVEQHHVDAFAFKQLDRFRTVLRFADDPDVIRIALDDRAQGAPLQFLVFDDCHVEHANLLSSVSRPPFRSRTARIPEGNACAPASRAPGEKD